MIQYTSIEFNHLTNITIIIEISALMCLLMDTKSLFGDDFKKKRVKLMNFVIINCLISVTQEIWDND